MDIARSIAAGMCVHRICKKYSVLLKELTEAAEQLFRFLNSVEDFQAAQQKQFKG